MRQVIARPCSKGNNFEPYYKQDTLLKLASIIRYKFLDSVVGGNPVAGANDIWCWTE